MVNKIRKGKRIERELEKILKENKFMTWKPTWSRFSSKDIFNIGDIIAMKSIGAFRRVYIIQVKSNINDFYTARRKLKEFINQNNLHFKEVAFMVALRLEKGKWRVQIYHNKLEHDLEIGNEEWDIYLTPLIKGISRKSRIFLPRSTIAKEPPLKTQI